MEDMLSKYISSDQRDWDDYLPVLMMAYRSSVHSSTGQTPSNLMLGREIALPADIMYGLNRLDPKSPSPYVEALKERMHIVHNLARKQMLKASDRQKKSYDHRLKKIPFQMGSAVFLHTTQKRKGVKSKTAIQVGRAVFGET